MTYGFRILRGEDRLAEGRMTSVCCELDPDRPPKPIPIPAAMREKLAEPAV